MKYGKSVEKLFVYESLLSWERGLKSKTGFNRDICQEVAPLVGAWIEIRFAFVVATSAAVAPLVGAWIEITHG